MEDISDSPSQKAAMIFLGRAITVWGQLLNEVPGSEPQESLPGFETFIYDRLVPSAFRVPSLPGFNVKDGQATTVSINDAF